MTCIVRLSGISNCLKSTFESSWFYSLLILRIVLPHKSSCFLFSLKLRTAVQKPVKSTLWLCPLTGRWVLGSAVPSSRVRDGLRLQLTLIVYSNQESTWTTLDPLFWLFFWLLHWQLLYFVEYVWLTSIYLSCKVVCLNSSDLNASLNVLCWVWHENCLQRLPFVFTLKSLWMLMYVQIHCL